MARKQQQPKELSRDEQIAESFKRISHYDLELIPPCPESRVLKVGDAVAIGNVVDATVAAVSEDNRVVVLEVHDKGLKYGQPYDNGRKIASAWPWYSVYAKPGIKSDNFFSTNDSVKALGHGHQRSSDLDGLISAALTRGYRCDPLYQRGYVWSEHDRERLLDSLFSGRTIGELLIVTNRRDDDYVMEILDGQQRLTTILDFFLSKFPYRGRYWHELSESDRRNFDSIRVSWIELEGAYLTPKMKAEIFLIVNDSGVPQTEEHLNKVRAFVNDAA